MPDVDPMNILPFDLQNLLKRKSSRDPNSRFTSKLHLLLNYVSQNPDLESKIGCAWVSDEEFRINKPIFGEIMGIKVNTLNVNLKTLGFQQQKHNKNGWTLWRKEGFTRNSNEIIHAHPAAQKPKPFSIPFSIGQLTPDDFAKFHQICVQIWSQITGNVGDIPIQTDVFILKAADRFRQPQQPLDNAKEVLQAIIAPQVTQTTVTFAHLCKFLAMFGPAESAMMKIASLLTVSNDTGQWLAFDPESVSTSHGFFDERQPNRLVLNFPDSGLPPTGTKSVWNLPLVDFNYNYICDELGHTYPSWKDYFDRNPINFKGMTSFM